MAFAGGWWRLAKDYSLASLPPGDVLTWQSARFGLINYNRVLKVAALPEGLYLAMPMLFAPGHPPLLVPWSAFTGYRERHLLFVNLAEFQISASRGPVRIQILRSLAKRLSLAERLGSA